ncbi:MAG TPA: cupin domain-containing protein [Prolixibacteraceae bacterium]|nr:cupin domain-containing protein [Prolixibacteraceae bacterium]HPS12882.1 cupin domain-containing protein [Prolixibacteraceae bacterium]
MKYASIYDETEPQKVNETTQRRLVYTNNLMMVNVEFTDGPTENPDPLHSHPHEQVSYLTEGEIFLLVGNEEKVYLKAGDHFAIPSNVPHSIHRLTPFVRIIDCFTPIREDFLK